MNNNTDRRNFLKNSAKGTLTLGLGLTALNVMAQADADDKKPAAAATTQDKEPVSTPSDKEPVTNEKQFRLGVIGVAELSKATSEMAVEKATDKDTKMFAQFELAEQIAMLSVLKEMGTPTPPMDPKSKATLEKVKSAKEGAAFDAAYLTAQVEGHEFLRDHATAYLKSSADKKDDMMEQHGRHLATVALATFKEHVAVSKKILDKVKA